MKKKWLIVGGILVAIAAVGAGILLWPKKFTLSPEYVGKSEFVEVSKDELAKLIDEKKSMAMFVYQPDCKASEDFEKILQSFDEKEKVVFIKVAFSDIRKSELVPGLKYYPSVALYNKGKMVDFLKTNEDEDMSAYQSEDGFREWWGKYIKE